jgi:hypothetical protein
MQSWGDRISEGLKAMHGGVPGFVCSFLCWYWLHSKLAAAAQ